MDTTETLQPSNACHATPHVPAVLETLLTNVKPVLTDTNLLEPLVLSDVSQDTILTMVAALLVALTALNVKM